MVNQQRLRVAGFTIIELMVSLAIVAVLLALAAPSFGQMVINSRIRGASTTLYLGLTRARSEATRTSAPVVMVRGANWESGWQIFGDTNNNGNPDGNEQIFVTQGPMRGITIVNGDNRVVYLATGRIRGGAPQFTIHKEGDLAGSPSVRCVSATTSGRPRVRHAEC